MGDAIEFGDGARKALECAREEAARLRHAAVGPEHILLGLLHHSQEERSDAVKIIRHIGVDLGKLRVAVERALPGPGKERIPPANLLPFTSQSKKALQGAMEETLRLGHKLVGTGHVLVGILKLKDKDSLVARVLNELGITLALAIKAHLELIEDAAGTTLESKSKAVVRKSKEGEKSKTPALDHYCRDLTAYAREGALDPVIGREKEIERMIEVLLRRKKNNPILIGEPGVGKTALVEGLAQRIASGAIADAFREHRVLSLDMAAMIAGTKYRGQFEERIKMVMEEIIRNRNVILFIDEIHTLIGAGNAEGAMDASNMLKPALARGELQCVGATTLEEYRKHIEKDGALERRFQTIVVEPSTAEEAVEILKGLRKRYEEYHRVTIPDESLVAAVRLSERYLSQRHLPDKAIDVIDEAAARVKLIFQRTPVNVSELEQELERVGEQKMNAVEDQQFEEAAKWRDKERKLLEAIEQKKLEWEKERLAARPPVGEEDIAFVVSRWSGIPVSRALETESKRLLTMEAELHRRVIGQDEAVSAVSRAIRRGRTKLKDPRRPVGSFIFAGPTGVGKTELARSLARFLFDDEKAMVRIDMSEYMEKHSVSRLIGAPPGYVGYEDGGTLTNTVRRRPYCVVLLDEIEKSHPDVFNILLQILDEGRLTDSQGRVVDFRHTVIIMTTNLGTSTQTRFKTAGFAASQDGTSDFDVMREKIAEEIEKAFAPEFRNRIDEVIVFHPLTPAHVKRIAAIFLGEVGARLREKSIGLTVSEEAAAFLAERGYDAAFGARPLKRVIMKYVEDPLSEKILAGDIVRGSVVEALLAPGGDSLVFNASAAPPEKAPVEANSE